LTPYAEKAVEMARNDRPFEDAPDGALLLGIFGEGAVIAHSSAEQDDAAEIPAPFALIGLHVADALTDPIAFGLRYGRENREYELRNAVAGHVAAEVDLEDDKKLRWHSSPSRGFRSTAIRWTSGF
jgi:hypothetical protein